MGFETKPIFHTWSFNQSPVGLKLVSLSIHGPGETDYICAISTQMLSPSAYAVFCWNLSYLGMTSLYLKDVNKKYSKEDQGIGVCLLGGFAGDSQQSPPKSLSSFSHMVPVEDSPSPWNEESSIWKTGRRPHQWIAHQAHEDWWVALHVETTTGSVEMFHGCRNPV